jgi:hypothetical protein
MAEIKKYEIGPESQNLESGVECNPFGIITMKDIAEYIPDPSLYLVGDGHIIRGRDRIHLIVGYAGVGKSRATTYLAHCGATGNKWFDYEIKHKFNTLFIQTENGLPRLKHDLGEMTNELDGRVFFADLQNGAQFHDPHFRNQMRSIIIQNKIGMVVIDPWTNLAPDIGHKDYNQAVGLVLDSLPEDQNLCPAVMVVAHCRKPDSNVRSKKGAELMHEVMGSQVLTSRSRFVLVMERADPSDSADNRVLVSCAKANDALDMPRSCHIRGKVLFESVPDYDWDERDQPQKPGRKPTYYLSDLVDLIQPGEQVTSREWKTRAKEKFNIGESTFYTFQSEATSRERVALVRHGVYRRVA